ncbi:MAG: hypothetical protein ACLR78_12755 [Roseburia sp.]
MYDADVLLLDEPTSNIDSLNEGMILRSLEAGMCGQNNSDGVAQEVHNGHCG